MTPNLRLQTVAAGQAQKHVTVNEALASLDALAQLSAISRTLAAPPANPAEGDCYIVPPDSTGAFAGPAGRIAVFDAGAWRFHEPRDGWRCYVAAEQTLLVQLAGAWRPAALPLSPAQLGVNTEADATNRLALKSPASLFDNAGAGHQLKINKATAGDTAAVLLQTGYDGRAEFGLAGDDKFRLKVSADGASWANALTFDQTTGLGQVAGAPTAANGIASKQYVDTTVAGRAAPFDYALAADQAIAASAAWTPIVGFSAARIASAAFDTTGSVFVAPAAGVYVFMAQIRFTTGGAAATITIACHKNGAPAGNWVSQSAPAGAQSGLSVISLLALAAGDAVGLAVNTPAGITLNLGFTALSGYRL